MRIPIASRKPPRHLYLFHHVAKCAGTSLVHAFSRTGRDGICLGFPCDRKSEVRRSARRQLLQRRRRLSQLRIFFGHRVYFGLHHLCPLPARYFTFLREPADRVVSLYNYHLGIATNPGHPLHDRDKQIMIDDGTPITFETWLKQHYSGNHLTRFLSYAMAGEEVDQPRQMNRDDLELAKQFLSRCWFIGFTDSSDADFRVVCNAVGVPSPTVRSNVSGQHVSLAESRRLVTQIESEDELDCELYEFAKELRGAIR